MTYENRLAHAQEVLSDMLKDLKAVCKKCKREYSCNEAELEAINDGAPDAGVCGYCDFSHMDGE